MKWHLFFDDRINFRFAGFPCLYQSRLLLRYPRQQFRRRFIPHILCHKLSAHGQIENKAAQASNRVGRVGDLLVMRQKDFRIHRASASARIAFNWSRRLDASVSAAVRLASNSSGSPWSSATVCGFLMSRL